MATPARPCSASASRAAVCQSALESLASEAAGLRAGTRDGNTIRYRIDKSSAPTILMRMEVPAMQPIRNVHARRVAAPLDRVRPWIEACWTGGDRDCFPRDVIASWRKNPAGTDPLALIPGETLVGHGPFRFRLRSWTGAVWRVGVVGRPRGWHGFDLEPDGDGCRVTHTLELDGTLSARLRWMTIEAIH